MLWFEAAARGGATRGYCAVTCTPTACTAELAWDPVRGVSKRAIQREVADELGDWLQ